ncbi:MAG: arsenate reductase (glutaredoxin) [Magnetospirillum sp.]|nr:arsenate reductase (glutaredoxin) [Magnetospirillum sp.]
MRKVVIYHNPRCTKSRETLKLLAENGVRAEIVEYLKTPPTAEELARILSMLAKSPRDILRKKEAAAAGIDAAGMDDDSLIRAMVAHPEVIERPIVVANGKAALGRPPESVLSVLHDR